MQILPKNVQSAIFQADRRGTDNKTRRRRKRKRRRRSSVSFVSHTRIHTHTRTHFPSSRILNVGPFLSGFLISDSPSFVLLLPEFPELSSSAPYGNATSDRGEIKVPLAAGSGEGAGAKFCTPVQPFIRHRVRTCAHADTHARTHEHTHANVCETQGMSFHPHARSYKACKSSKLTRKRS